MQPIIYKRVEDLDGHNSWVELWQGDQHIKISLEPAGTTGHPGQAKWKSVKLYMDNLLVENKPSGEELDSHYGDKAWTPRPIIK